MLWLKLNCVSKRDHGPSIPTLLISSLISSLFTTLHHMIEFEDINRQYFAASFNGQEYSISLRWRHNGCDSVSNHQPHHFLLNRLFRRRSKKTSKLRVTGLCAGNSTGAGEFSAQMAGNAENVSIWWRRHVSKWNINQLISNDIRVM